MATKGQVYIMIAGMIIIAISTLASIGIYTSMPIEKEQTGLSNTEAMVHNINNEIVEILKQNYSDTESIDDFANFTLEYGNEKNINITIDDS